MIGCHEKSMHKSDVQMWHFSKEVKGVVRLQAMGPFTLILGYE